MSGALGGVGVTLVATYGVRAVNLAITFVMAATLGPDGMGVLAAALVGFELVDVVRDLGMREALVHRQTLCGQIRRAASFIVIATAVAQASALGLFALARYLTGHDPMTSGVFAALAPLFLINALGSVPDALLQRDRRFGARAAAEIAAVAAKLPTALWLLNEGAGVWAMVFAILASSTTRWLVLTAYAGSNLPIVVPLREDARWLIRYGGYIVSNNIAYFLRLKSDQLAIVSFVGQAALGIYFMASRLPELFISSVNMAISTVAFPHYARLGEDMPRLRDAYLHTLGASMLVMAPVSVGAAILGPPVMVMLLGEEWRETGLVMSLLMLSGIPITLGWACGDVLKARGLTQVLATVSWIEAVLAGTLTTTVAVLTGDLRQVAVAMLVGTVFGAGVRLWVIRREIEVSPIQTIRLTMPAIGAAICMAGPVWYVCNATLTWPSLGSLAISVAIGIVAYGVLIGLFDHRHIGRLIRVAREVQG